MQCTERKSRPPLRRRWGSSWAGGGRRAPQTSSRRLRRRVLPLLRLLHLLQQLLQLREGRLVPVPVLRLLEQAPQVHAGGRQITLGACAARLGSLQGRAARGSTGCSEFSMRQPCRHSAGCPTTAL